MAPKEVVDAFRTMRESDLELLAIVHSHPRTAPNPSHVDLAEVRYPNALMVIVGFANEAYEVAAWRISPEKSSEPKRVPFRVD